jgi:hypothetical protein
VANRALLLAMYSTDPPWDHDGRYFRDALLGANASVPILWLSLFDTDGLVTWPGIHDGSPYTAVIQPTRECIERSRARLENWTRRWPQVFTDMSKPWLSYVGAVEDAYLAIWTEELTWFYREEERETRWAAELRANLSCLDDPESARFRAKLAEIGLKSDGRFEPNYFIGVQTAGYTWARQAPWEGAGHGPLVKDFDHSGCRICAR